MANELAQNCAFLAREGNRIRLALDPGHRNLLGRERESRLGKALSDYLGSPLQVAVELQGPAEETPAQAQARARDERQQQAVRAIEEDTNVQALREAFEARVRPDTIKPLD
jgi:DNA polymerase-3 subunit gamma/tau